MTRVPTVGALLRAGLSATLLLSRLVIAYTLAPSGSTLSLNEVPYYVPAEAVGSVQVSEKVLRDAAGGLVPMTAFSVAVGGRFGPSEVRDLVGRYKGGDDVWQEAFLKGTVMLRPAIV